ncbi:MAG: hypothetical protein QOI98_2292 [Solirubrobacteraceae bacterium]|nr:hypothetical protein [Solirubrobacteraceae bacterium]
MGVQPVATTAGLSPSPAPVASVSAPGRAAFRSRPGASRRTTRVSRPATPRVTAAPFGPLRRSSLSKPLGDNRTPAPPTVDHQGRPALITQVLQVMPPLLGAILIAAVALALLLAGASMTSELRSRRLRRQRAALRADVGLLQSALLPAVPALVGPVGASAAYRPAEGPAAGGDFYDLFAMNGGRVGLVVGDVAGHGREALPRTALVRYTLRAYLEAGLAPRAALQMAASLLARDLDGSGVTVALAVYDEATRLLTYSCAGHPPPLVAGVDWRPVTACSSPPIGLGLSTGRRQTTLSLPDPATVCFYTDGVTDATSGGLPFGEARLELLVRQMAAKPNAQALVDAVASGTDRQPDDMAACLFRVGEAESTVAQTTLEELELDAATVLTGDRLERFLAACDVPAGDFAVVRQRAEHLAGREGAIVVAVRRVARTVSVEVDSSRVRVLDPVRAMGLAAAG